MTLLVLVGLAALALVRLHGPGEAPARFDGQRAMDDLREMALRGQRWYGAPEREQALQEMVARFRPVVDEVIRHEVPVPHPDSGEPITLVNMILRQHPERPRRLLVGSHWDTRLWAEEDPDPARRALPIQGANDGTSGVAVMAEMARVLRATPLASAGVDLVLFDGEEYGRPGNREYCQGSQAFARDLERWYPGGLPVAAVIMDMVGDRDLTIRQEVASRQRAPALLEVVWQAAGRLGVGEFVAPSIGPIYDDHSPLQERGIPSILLIDYDYPEWHTHADTIEKCGPDSLAKVGSVVLDALRHLDAPTP